MAVPFFSTPIQPFVYQSPQDAVIPFQILGNEAQIVQIMLKPQEKIIAKHEIDQAIFRGEILCQPDAFLCSINDVKGSNTFDQRARNMIASAEGSLRHKISAQGLAFIVRGGSVVQKSLEVGEVLVVDVASIVALSGTINFQAKCNGQMRRAVFGNDNLITAVLTARGIVFIQSMPFHRLSQRIARAVTSPNMRDNPKFFLQIAIFLFIAYVVIVSSLILTCV